MTHRFGVILAGGGGARLGGVRKADLRVGRQRLIHRVARAFEGEVDSLLVASGQDGKLVVPMHANSVRDEASEPEGPLAGFRAAMRFLADTAAPRDIVVFVAVDTPFLPSDYVIRLTYAAQQHRAAFAAWGDNFYPTNCAWMVDSLRQALDAARPRSGPRSILAAVDAKRLDWQNKTSEDPFANINTVGDLMSLQRRALGPIHSARAPIL